MRQLNLHLSASVNGRLIEQLVLIFVKSYQSHTSELTPSYPVLQAPDGEAGRALVQAKPPDVVLTDVMMPRMDGYELTRLIKNNPATDPIAVVMLKAKEVHPSRIEGL